MFNIKKIYIITISLFSLCILTACENNNVSSLDTPDGLSETPIPASYDVFEKWSEEALALIDALPSTQREALYSAINSSFAYDGIPLLSTVEEPITYEKVKDLTDWPDNVKRVVSIVDQEMFEDTLFPHRNTNSHLDSTVADQTEYYTYMGFLKAAAKYPMFCNEDFSAGMNLQEVCAKELATMFAHFTQETGASWTGIPGGDGNHARQGLYWFGETTHHNNGSFPVLDADTASYCNSWGEWGTLFPCSVDGHYGRGAKQISWNYNYARYSLAMFDDFRILFNPTMIETEPFLAIASAFWFYMTPTSGKPSMHDVVSEKYNGNDAGFGLTINIINGSYECGRATDQAANRLEYYEYFMTEFGIWENFGRYENNTCIDQTVPVSIAEYEFPMYWRIQEWNNMLTTNTYETGYSILIPSTYDALKESWSNTRYPERYYQ